MSPVNPDDPKALNAFLMNWKSHYPDITRGKGKEKTTTPGLKPPTMLYMRILYSYSMHGDIPGEHVVAMLQNDLYRTFNTCPADEVEFIPSSVQYITTYLPTESWGNVEKYGKWIQKLQKTKIGQTVVY